MARRRRVAVLVDASPGSMRACRYGAQHVFDKNTDVMLVTAVHDKPPVSYFSTGRDDLSSALELSFKSDEKYYTGRHADPNSTPYSSPQDEGDRILDHHKVQLLNCKLPETRIEKVIVHPRKNESTASAVLRASKKADSIICGTRGLGAFQNSLLKAVGLGSLSHDIVQNATVPVTVVPITTPVCEMIEVREGVGVGSGK